LDWFALRYRQFKGVCSMMFAAFAETRSLHRASVRGSPKLGGPFQGTSFKA
jgi:hypothetical protein